MTDLTPTFAQDKRDFDSFPLHQALGLTLVEARPGFARIVLQTSRTTLGGIGGSVHGGITAAMIDMATLEALVPMRQDSDQFNGTADLNITYMRPALGAKIFAEATVIRKGRTMAVTEVSIIDEQGRLCAKGRTIYAIKPIGPNA